MVYQKKKKVLKFASKFESTSLANQRLAENVEFITTKGEIRVQYAEINVYAERLYWFLSILVVYFIPKLKD